MSQALQTARKQEQKKKKKKIFLKIAARALGKLLTFKKKGKTEKTEKDDPMMATKYRPTNYFADVTTELTEHIEKSECFMPLQSAEA